jgi:hypothetical protein
MKIKGAVALVLGGAYSASKSGIVALTLPAATIPHPSRLRRPKELGALACHIVENGYITGEVIRLDDSLRMAPR